ncbi:MAG: right-handed parallel beta-helix repeat-containing protein [Planctomycetes bacterium]|nr:right-handed parallel beta-helix repeat-containing protein [Planctomycetota bacterium]
MKAVPMHISGENCITHRKNFRILLASCLLVAAMRSTIVAGTIYVDSRADGSNNGSSWADAYKYLQDALADADSAEKPVEILIAQGVYKPDQGRGKNPNDRGTTFQMINGVAFKGGFAGSDAPNPDARDIRLYKTVLSGDLTGNDVAVNDPRDLLDESTRTENSYHVVTSNMTGKTAVLDGLTITAGSRNGMYNKRGSPVIINCTFSENCADRWGGGMCNENGSPSLSHCIFSRNLAQYGGGIWNFKGAPILTCCTFTGNSATYGGAIYNYDNSHPQMTCCTFTGNSATHGGCIYNNKNCRPIVTNCTLTGNSANSDGGAMRNLHYSSPILTNCILWGNSPDEIIDYFMSSSTVSYSYVQGGTGNPWFGKGCIDGDPLFFGANNLRLSPGSPCIDAGDNSAVPSEITTTIDGMPRIFNGTVDMGAFEAGSI